LEKNSAVNPSEIYTQRQAVFQAQTEVIQRRYNQLSTARLAIFILAAAAVWWFSKSDLSFAFTIRFLGLVLFAIVLRKHQKTSRLLNLYRILTQLNKEETARLSLSFLRKETGEEFAPPNHPYAYDLDVFGKHSLFKLINRAHTKVGMKTLAHWLLAPADPIEITVRQLAIAELTPLLDWRQEFEATAALEKQISQSTEFLSLWLKAGENESILRWKRFRWLPILTILGIIAASLGLIPWLVIVAVLLFHGFILSKLNASVKAYAEQSEQIIGTLKAYAALFEKIENQSFESAKLRQLKSQLTTGISASKSIQQLAKMTENLNFRLNPYFILAIGLPSLWDLQWMTQLEAWKKHHQDDLGRWFHVLGQFEALSSFAGFAYSNPAYPFAELSTEPFYIKTKHVGHPLIAADKRVCNDFELQGLGQTAIITGSNMSGKSTFLRTIGVNTILALSGSVICAEQFSSAILQVFTSMRTQDSLEENTSSFYAELKRLQTLLKLSESSPIPVFYFLDEILKGTNSVDRHKGAEALIRQLHLQKAAGFISTHDIELGDMANEGQFAHNYSFYSTFTEGKLHFDYQLKEGVCREFNATALMRQIGIEIP